MMITIAHFILHFNSFLIKNQLFLNLMNKYFFISKKVHKAFNDRCVMNVFNCLKKRKKETRINFWSDIITVCSR